MRDVERIAAVPPAEFSRRFEATETPVVIVGGARDFAAVRSWSPDYLKHKLGSIQLEHKLSASHQHPNFRAASLAEAFARGRSSFSEFLDAITQGPVTERARRLFTGDERFLLQRRDGETRTDPELSILLDDVRVPELVPTERLFTIWAWFSGAGVRTWLHYDNNGCHNLNAQLTGSKRCVLYPPSELARLRPFLLGGANPAHNCSEIDVEAEQPSGVSAFAAILEAGDLLFIPAWWLHTFVHLGDFNSNVNFWWKPERPTLNPVAVRQAFLDAVGAAGIPAHAQAPHASLLIELDRALVDRA